MIVTGFVAMLAGATGAYAQDSATHPAGGAQTTDAQMGGGGAMKPMTPMKHMKHKKHMKHMH